MWPESGEEKKPLRTGLTTGCCATACSIAAAKYLLQNKESQSVAVTLPRGQEVRLIIDSYRRKNQNRVLVSTIKDAGDDPDVTHGARVFVDLGLTDSPDIQFAAAEGVGTVTRAGLALGIGEPAINPVPRKMITDHLRKIAKETDYSGGFRVAVGIENGESLALKTMNARLGIIGGLSILGTTGIVRPFSCSAYIASIHQAIDVARANAIEHLAATTGNTSEAFIRDHYQLPEISLIEMGDFVGAVLKYIRRAPIARLSIAGGFGKISKLAVGHLDLHSRRSSIDFEWLGQCAGKIGAPKALQKKIKAGNTSAEILQLCHKQGIELGDAVCRAALEKAKTIVSTNVEIEVWAVNMQGGKVGMAKET